MVATMDEIGIDENNDKMDRNGKKVFYWKRKRVTEAVYNQRLSQVNSGKKRKKSVTESHSKHLKSVTESHSEHNLKCVEKVPGRRLVDISVMGENLFCPSCKEILSLCDITEEQRAGLASVFTIQCQKCLDTTKVQTDRKHPTKSGKFHFDVNSEAVLGILHAGMGYSHLNKFLGCVNAPPLHSRTFKNHEREIGPIVEDVAKESCKKWTQVEREATIENAENLKTLFTAAILQNELVVKCRCDTNNLGSSNHCNIHESK